MPLQLTHNRRQADNKILLSFEVVWLGHSRTVKLRTLTIAYVGTVLKRIVRMLEKLVIWTGY